MKDAKASSPELAEIWGDTVNLKHLGGAMLIGVLLGFGFFWSGLHLIKAQYPAIQGSLQTAIALLVGIFGCLLAAVISAKLFGPKRTLTEQEFSAEDRLRVLQDLQVDMSQEAADMKTMPAEILAEMRELQLDAMFQTQASNKGEV